MKRFVNVLPLLCAGVAVLVLISLNISPSRNLRIGPDISGMRQSAMDYNSTVIHSSNRMTQLGFTEATNLVLINVGLVPNDGTGDTVSNAFRIAAWNLEVAAWAPNRR